MDMEPKIYMDMELKDLKNPKSWQFKPKNQKIHCKLYKRFNMRIISQSEIFQMNISKFMLSVHVVNTPLRFVKV